MCYLRTNENHSRRNLMVFFFFKIQILEKKYFKYEFLNTVKIARASNLVIRFQIRKFYMQVNCTVTVLPEFSKFFC